MWTTAAAVFAFGFGSVPLHAQAPAVAEAAATTARSGDSVDDFYRARADKPLWLAPGSGKAAEELLDLLDSSRADGLKPDRYRTAPIDRLLGAARAGERKAAASTESMLSRAFVAYVQDLREAPDFGVIYVDPELRPKPPSARAILEGAAAS